MDVAKELAQHVFNHDKHYWALIQWMKRKGMNTFDLCEIFAEGATVAGEIWDSYKSDTRPDHAEKYHAASALQPQWVSVKERLPEEETYVLVEGGLGYVDREGQWRSGTGLSSGNRLRWEVTHWMYQPEFPAPPTEQNERADAEKAGI